MAVLTWMVSGPGGRIPWILRDVVDNRAGFPDLVQFWPDETRYRLVEVKGPGDRLQDNQRRFLEFCAAHGMPVFVCQVRERAAVLEAPVRQGLSRGE